jgi:hypothetical protein
LSKLDPYDEEHHKGTRSIGVFLQGDENPFDRVSLLIGAQVKEIKIEEASD